MHVHWPGMASLEQPQCHVTCEGGGDGWAGLQTGPGLIGLAAGHVFALECGQGQRQGLWAVG